MGPLFSARGITADAVVSRTDFKPLGIEHFDVQKQIAAAGAFFVSKAEKLLDEPYPQLCASVYMQFIRNGNRSNYEALYFRRREMLTIFAIAELYEGKGRFL